jgi:hypothetical protein
MLNMPLEDRLAIMELSSLYAMCCDTHEFSKMAELFTDDCIYDESCVGVERVENKAELLRVFEVFAEQLGPVVHTSSNHIISQYSGSLARGICYVWAEGYFSEALGGGVLRTAGYYDDVYVKHGGQWYFKERVLRCLVPSVGATTIGGITYDAQRKHLNALEQRFGLGRRRH